MEEGVPARNKENTNKINSVKTSSDLKDKSDITIEYKSDEILLLIYLFINKSVK